MLAMERGEVQGVGGTTWSSLKAQSRQLLSDKKIRVIVQYTKKKHAELPDVPTIYEFAKTDEHRKVMDAAFAYQSVGRAYITPPGVPANVLKTFRDAFDATIKDPTFLGEAKKRGIELDPAKGSEIEQVVADIAATPADIVDKINGIKGEQPKKKK
jgi:tripartite-type tricarboxylate transporter receptor subunit TctC